MAEPDRSTSRIPRGSVIPLIALLLWWGSTASGVFGGPLVVTPLQVLKAPFFDPSGRELWASLATSLIRVFVAGIIGGFLGIVLGYLAGMFRSASLGISPSIHAARQVALFAWIPLLTAWFGNGELTKVVFTSLSTFFPLFLATEHGVRQTPTALVEAADVLKLTFRTRLFQLYFPATLPSIYVGLQIAVLSAWIGTIGAEYAIGNGRGLGSYLASARDQFRMDIVLVGVFALAAGGVFLNYVIGQLAGYFSPWTKVSK
jgi:sulfonate transport system permease protein